jgi:hypothetical protein
MRGTNYMKNSDPTLEFLKAHSLPLTKDNYLYVAYMGQPPESAEEIDFPVEIIRATRRLIASKDAEFLREIGARW